MPVARYFFVVGGTLLLLLLVSGWLLPKFPMTETAGVDTDKSFLRISSDRKWPERVVFDTSVAPFTPGPQIAEAAAPPTMDTVVDVSARVRDTFAQLLPPEPKKPEPKPQRKRKIAKKHHGPPTILVAQQPRFGFFGSSIW
jgi:hypothetical protein